MYDNSDGIKKPQAGPWRFDSSRHGLFQTFGIDKCKERSICYHRGCELVGRSGARLPHTTLPEKFDMWKVKNADLGMFHKILQCNGQTFGIDLRSPRPRSGRWGEGGGCGGARTSPSLLLPENLESTDLETLFLECFIRCFFRKFNLIHLGIILPIKPFFL